MNESHQENVINERIKKRKDEIGLEIGVNLKNMEVSPDIIAEARGLTISKIEKF